MPNNKILPEKEDTFFLLSELHKQPHLTQRELATKLNISLGKTNYLIHELIKKGFLKAREFSKSSGKEKIKKIKYNLTAKGIERKIDLTYHFLKRKETEYNHIKKEWEELVLNNNLNNQRNRKTLSKV